MDRGNFRWLSDACLAIGLDFGVVATVLERAFIDLARSSLFLTDEHEIFEISG